MLPSTEKETYSAAFYGNGKLFVAVASFNPNILNGRTATDIAVRLPRSILPRFNPTWMTSPSASLVLVLPRFDQSPDFVENELPAQ